MPEAASKQVFFSGRVQGVGFRFTTRELAKGYEVTGWVKNLSDGRVELQVAGEPAEIQDFLTAIRESSLRHHIQGTEIRDIPPLENVSGFTIAR